MWVRKVKFVTFVIDVILFSNCFSWEHAVKRFSKKHLHKYGTISQASFYYNNELFL